MRALRISTVGLLLLVVLAARLAAAQTPPAPIQSITQTDYDRLRCRVSIAEPDAVRGRAEQGDADAQLLLGMMYYQPANSFPEDHKLALLWLRKAADQGNVMAENQIGAIYDIGKAGVQHDREEARRWYLRAANHGDSVAAYNIGTLYQEDKAFTEALNWHTRAAEHENWSSLEQLLNLHERGLGVRKSKEDAVEMLRGMATKDVGVAQAYLAILTLEGKYGIKKDKGEAGKLMRKAAAKNLPLALSYLGHMTMHGDGVPKDEAAGAELYRKAAELCWAQAQANLGWAYEHGNGVPKDRIAAYTFYVLAEESGSNVLEELAPNFKNGVFSFYRHLSATESAEAHARARQWKLDHCGSRRNN